MAFYYGACDGTKSGDVSDSNDWGVRVSDAGVYSAEYAGEADDSGSVSCAADDCGVSGED